MQKINSNIKNIFNKYKRNPLIWIIFSLMLSFVLGFFAIVYKGYESKEVVSIIQIFILPLSLGATAITISKNNENHKTSIELEKIKMTNDFISEFREAMGSLVLCQENGEVKFRV